MARDPAPGPRLPRGDLLPEIVTPPPGPRSRQLSLLLAEVEAPGINTLVDGEPSLLWEEARGANVLDVDGNRYLDLTAGFGAAAVGHRHPRVVAAVRSQAGRLLHALGDVAAHPLRPRLASRLASLVPVPRGRVYFAVSGADAVEIAWKTACLATGRPAVLAFEPAYHGLTLGALALTSREAFRRPFGAALNPGVLRLPYGCDPGRIEVLLARHPEIGAIFFEPIVGREGILIPPTGWLAALVRIARDRSVLTVADEVLTGFGRTGRWFAVEHDDIQPDLLVCGKALGGGLPIAAVVGSRELTDAWKRPGEALHTATFVAHPLACAAALATLDLLCQRDLAARAARLETLLRRRTDGWTARFPQLREARGRGLLWGFELSTSAAAARLVSALRDRGVLALAGGPRGDVLELVPPLTLTRRQLVTALDLLEDALAELSDA